MIDFLVKHGYRVLAVFYRLFEGASTHTRVEDLEEAYTRILTPLLTDRRRRARRALFLGISWGCTVVTQWLQQARGGKPNLVRGVVLLHPVFGFWDAAGRLCPGLDWFSSQNRRNDPSVAILDRIREIHSKRISIRVIACQQDMFTNCDEWQRWCETHKIPLVRLSNPRRYTPYQQHFYARYDCNGHEWISCLS
jgi:pimeloyl-ACP methyl ester carboxylesterase